MGYGNDTLDDLNAAFLDPSLEEVVVYPSGEVYFGAESGRRPSPQPLGTHQAAALADWLSEAAGVGEEAAFEIATEHAQWTVMRPPLAADFVIIGRRLHRPRRLLNEWIDLGVISPDAAQCISEAIRLGRSLLVASPTLSQGQIFLETLTSLVSPGHIALSIGDIRRQHHGRELTFIDRISLDYLSDVARAAVTDALRSAHWVFSERIATPIDLDWWYGSQCFARGRIGVISALSAKQALERLQDLHRLCFAYQGPVSPVTDLVVLVEHLRPGRNPGVTVHETSTLQPTLAAEHPIPRQPVARLEMPQSDVTPPPTSLIRQHSSHSGLRAVPEQETAQRAESHPALPAQTTNENPVRRQLHPRTNDATPAHAEPQRRVSQPGTLPPRPASLTSMSPVVAAVEPEPAPAGLRRSLTPSIATPRTPPPASDDIFAEVEADFSLDASHPAEIPPEDDIFGDLNLEPAASDDGGQEGGSGMFFSPEELDELGAEAAAAVSDAAPAPAPTHERNTGTGGASRYSADTVRHDADSIRAQRTRTTTGQHSAPTTDPASGRPSGARWRPVAGRGAATPATARTSGVFSPRPETPASSPAPKSGFMQEGTLDADAPFADEPTRRAEWPDSRNVLKDIAQRSRGIPPKK